MSALFALAEPNSSTRSCGWSACVAAAAANVAVTFDWASLLSPATSKLTSIDRPSAERRAGLTTAPVTGMGA